MNRRYLTGAMLVVASTIGFGRVPGVTAQTERPVPDSHRSANWWETHDDAARSGITLCAVCHTSTGCRSCHLGPVPDVFSQLPAGEGPGEITRSAPPTHTPTFAESHRAAAAAAPNQCQTCHVADQCSSCHSGSEALTTPARRVAGYHPANFIQQHSARAFGSETECVTCHNPEAFCRDCHGSRGMTTVGRTETGFHNRKPLFEFGHGQAARQSLESCATCHAQSDCLICHSAVSGRGVNPHGREFDAGKLRSKAPATCLRCHTSAILNRLRLCAFLG